MSRRLMRISLAFVFLLSSEVWAIGLGDIELDSALNEPLRAEIDLLSATPEELSGLKVAIASAETFARYGIDRPFYLQEIEFNVTSGPDGAVVQVRSRSPVTEPFLTFLVEATWASGRLLREYTVLLDPPTYAPPAVQQAPAVEAPRRATPTDSGRIERQQPVAQPEPPPQPQPEPQPSYTPPSRPAPQAQPSDSGSSYSTSSGGDYYVERGDTLWGIASRMRPDSRLTMNQTMLAIFEANRDAFSGNINRLKAGASLRIPSADDVFQISRGDAFSEVKRQNEDWGGPSTPDTSYADTSTDSTYDDTAYEDTTTEDTSSAATDATYDTSVADQPATETSLTLVPPDEEPAGVGFDDELDTSEPTTREQEIEQRIAELEGADVPNQQSLIEIRDNELAALRQELSDIRNDALDMGAEDELYADDEAMDGEDAMADEAVADDAAAEADDAAAEPDPTTVVRTTRVNEPSIMDRVMGVLGSFWTKIVAALVLVAGVLLWFVRRGREDEDDSGPWETLDSDELAAGAMAATATLSAPSHEESIVVVEQDSGIRSMDDDTIEAPSMDLGGPSAAADPSDADDTGQFDSLEDTFSSETAVNLDQTDPLAEADFHMAYGLYDQAADLINGALQSDPNDVALMSKLCEIYFVWGNRDAFVDAAAKLNGAVGGGDSSEWDKIVIMGQQIAADHELFAGAEIAGKTGAVDLSFEAEMDDAAELDMDLGGADDAASDVVDLGAEEPGSDSAGDDGVDFLFDDDSTAEVPVVEDFGTDITAEMPAPDEPTVETPTIEQQFEGMEGTSELPSLDESLGDAISESGQDADATAEINLDELDLDVDSLAETELASLDDLDETEVATLGDLDETGTNEILNDLNELADITGKNPEIDPNETGVREAIDLDATAIGGSLDLDDLDDNDATGMRLAPDETGRMPTMDSAEESDPTVDADLLDATGHTQILSEDLAVETGVGMDADAPLGDDEKTMLAPMDEDEDDFDFAKTEALPPEAFTGNSSLDETGEMPAVGDTDVDLDLDDLTAALQVSEAGDTVEQLRDDATVEQPRPNMGDETAETPTMSLGPEDMSEDLHEARTMTEVGTKLDLARAYVDMGDPAGARSILEEVLDEGDEGQRQQAQQLLDSLPS